MTLEMVKVPSPSFQSALFFCVKDAIMIWSLLVDRGKTRQRRVSSIRGVKQVLESCRCGTRRTPCNHEKVSLQRINANLTDQFFFFLSLWLDKLDVLESEGKSRTN